MNQICIYALAVLAIAGLQFSGIQSLEALRIHRNDGLRKSRREFIQGNLLLEQEKQPFPLGTGYQNREALKDSIVKSNSLPSITTESSGIQQHHIGVGWKRDEKPFNIEADPLRLGASTPASSRTNTKPKKENHAAPMATTYLGENTDEVVTPQESLASMVSKPIYQQGPLSMYRRKTPEEEGSDGEHKFMYSPEETENNEMMREREQDNEREGDRYSEQDQIAPKGQERDADGYDRREEDGRQKDEERYTSSDRENQNEDSSEQKERDRERYQDDDERGEERHQDASTDRDSERNGGSSYQDSAPFRGQGGDEESSFRHADNYQRQDNQEGRYPEREGYFRDEQDGHSPRFDKPEEEFSRFRGEQPHEKPMAFASNGGDGYGHDERYVSDGIEDQEVQREGNSRDDKRTNVYREIGSQVSTYFNPLRKRLINNVRHHRHSKQDLTSNNHKRRLGYYKEHVSHRRSTPIIKRYHESVKSHKGFRNLEHVGKVDNRRWRRSDDSPTSYDAYGSIGQKVPQNLPSVSNGASLPTVISDRPMEANALDEQPMEESSLTSKSRKCGETDNDDQETDNLGYKRRISLKEKLKFRKTRMRRSSSKDVHNTAKKAHPIQKIKPHAVTEGKKKKITDRDYVRGSPDERSTEHSTGIMEDNEQEFLQNRLDRDAEPILMKIAEHDRDDFHKLWDNSHSPGNGYYAGNGEGPSRPYLGDYMEHNVEDGHHDRFDPLVPVNSVEHNVEAHAVGDQTNEDQHTTQLIDAIWDHDTNDDDRFEHGSHHIEERPSHSQKVLSYFNHRDHDVLLPTETLDGIAGHWESSEGRGGGGEDSHSGHWGDEFPQAHVEHHHDDMNPAKIKAIQAIQDDPSIDSDLQTLGVGIEMGHAHRGHGGGHEGMHGLHDVGVMHQAYHEGPSDYMHDMHDMHDMHEGHDSHDLHDVHDLHELSAPHPEHMNHLMEGLEAAAANHEPEQVEDSHEEEYKQHNDALLHHYHALEEHMKGMHGNIFSHLDEGGHALHHHSHNRYHSGYDLYAYKNPWDNIRLPYHVPVVNHPMDTPPEPEAGGGSHESGGKGGGKGEEKGGPMAGEGGKEGPLAEGKPNPVDDKAKGGEPAKEGKGDKKPSNWGQLPLPVIPKQRGDLLTSTGDNDVSNTSIAGNAEGTSLANTSSADPSAAQMDLLQHASKQFLAGVTPTEDASNSAMAAAGNKVTAMQTMLENMLKESKGGHANVSEKSASLPSNEERKPDTNSPAAANTSVASLQNLDPLQLARLQQLTMMQEAMQKSIASQTNGGAKASSEQPASPTADLQSKILQLQALAAVATSAAPDISTPKVPGITPASLTESQASASKVQASQSVDKAAKQPQTASRKVLPPPTIDQLSSPTGTTQPLVADPQANKLNDILKGLKQKLAMEQSKTSPLSSLLQGSQLGSQPAAEEKPPEGSNGVLAAKSLAQGLQESKMKQLLGGIDLPRGTSKDTVGTFLPKLATENPSEAMTVEREVGSEGVHSASALGAMLLKKAEPSDVTLKQLKSTHSGALGSDDAANISSATMWKDALLQQLSDKGKRRHHLGLKLVAKSKSENPYSTIGFEPPTNERDAFEETGSKRENGYVANLSTELQKQSQDISLHDDARDMVTNRELHHTPEEKETNNSVAKAKVPGTPTDDDLQSKKSNI